MELTKEEKASPETKTSPFNVIKPRISRAPKKAPHPFTQKGWGVFFRVRRCLDFPGLPLLFQDQRQPCATGNRNGGHHHNRGNIRCIEGGFRDCRVLLGHTGRNRCRTIFVQRSSQLETATITGRTDSSSAAPTAHDLTKSAAPGATAAAMTIRAASALHSAIGIGKYFAAASAMRASPIEAAATIIISYSKAFGAIAQSTTGRAERIIIGI